MKTSRCVSMADESDLALPLVLALYEEEGLGIMYMDELEIERQCQAAEGVTFNLKDFSAKRSLEQFRFIEDEVCLLCNLLRIPDPIVCETRIRVSASFGLLPGFEATCIPLSNL